MDRRRRQLLNNYAAKSGGAAVRRATEKLRGAGGVKMAECFKRQVGLIRN